MPRPKKMSNTKKKKLKFKKKAKQNKHLMEETQEPKSMRENEQQALMEKTQGIDLKNCDSSSSEDEQEQVIVLGYTDWEMD